MDERKQEIIEKVQKCLLLSQDESTTEAERDNARRSAALLMAKFRIAETEIDLEMENFIMDHFFHEADEGEIPQWVGRVCSVFSNVFDTQVLWRDKHFPYGREYEVIGTFSDVETVLYFIEVAVHHIEQAGWEVWPSERNWRKRNQLGNHAVDVLWRRASELKVQMDETIHEDSSCTALVVKKMDEIDAAIKEMYPNMKSTDIELDRADDDKTIDAGLEAGNTVPLNFAIED